MDDCQLKLLIRVDASPEIGIGHIMRMIALGQAWNKQRGATTFVCSEAPNALIRRINHHGFQTYQIANSIGGPNDARNTLEIAEAVRPDWIVLDGTRFDATYQRSLSASSAKIMLIDDLGDRPSHHAHLLLSPNRQRQIPLAASSDQGHQLSGLQYVLLNSEQVANERSERRIFKNARRILVNFSGQDPDNWTLRILKILSALSRPRMVIDCVIGTGYEHILDLVAFKKTANMHLRIHRNVDRMNQLMQFVDVAISAGESTCYEFANSGVPTIAIPIADTQRSVVKSLTDCQAAIGVNPVSCDKDISRKIRSFLNNAVLRETVSMNAKQLVDGRGANRVAEKLAFGCFRFRPADFEDAEQIWIWRNDPEVRALSFNSERIHFRQHQAWLREKLASDDTRIWIVETNDRQTIANIRADFHRDGMATISIVVDPAKRGRGLGTILIRQAAEKIFSETLAEAIVAQVRPVNIASERAFRKAGFSLETPTTIQGKVAYQFVLRKEEIAPFLMEPVSFLKKSA